MIGKTISHYKILEKLGEGGMGVVYLAEDTELDRKVCLKFLPPYDTSDKESKARFKHEAKAAAALNHPNIITIHEVGEHEGQSYIAMEYVEGQALSDVIANKESTLNEVIEIAGQICEGLQAAHEAGIVHRDIKPDNILLDNKKHVKILDFGLAKLKGATRLTKESSTLGTMNYMSPEQIRSSDVDHGSDIFSLGVVLYEMITGQLPFGGDYEAAVTYSILSEEPEPLARYKSGVSDELQRIVDKALSKDISTRYQSSADLLADLNGLRKGSGLERSHAVREKFSQKSTPKLPVISAGVVILAILAITLYFVAVRQSSPQERIPIAVVDFVNETGESELDGLSGMLITALEQSRRLSVLTRTRMFDILKQMGKADFSHIDEVLGREICQYADIRVMAIASVKKFGRVYTMDLKLIDTHANEYLFTANEKGEGQESVPDMIDKLAERTRIGLKEAEEEIQAASRKVAMITTPSLEAYQHYFKGEELVNKLKNREAQEEFKQAIKVDSTFGLGYLALAYAIFQDDGNEQLVKDYVQKAVTWIDHVPEKEQYLVRMYDAVLKEGPRAGIEILKEMQKKYPDSKEMLHQLGALHFDEREFEDAEQYLKKVLDMDPNHERALHLLAWTAYRMRKYGEAEQSFRQALEINPKSARAHDGLGWTYYQMRNYVEGEQSFRQALAINPKLARAHNGLGHTYHQIRKYAEAEQSYHRALDIDPNYVDAINGLGWAYNRMGKFAEAEQLFLQAIKSQPKLTDALRGLGHSFSGQAKHKNAEEVFRKALALDPRHPAIIRELGDSFIYQGNFREAEKVFLNGLKQAPENRGFLDWLAKIQIWHKDYDAAESYYAKYLRVRPESRASQIFFELQSMAIDLLRKNYSLAEEHIRKALALDSTHVAANRYLAYLFAEQEKFVEAGIYASKSLAQDSSFSNYNLMAWILVDGTQDVDLGIEMAHMAIESQPSDWQRFQNPKIFTFVPVPEHTLGVAYRQKEQYKKAVEYLELAIKLVPDRQRVKDDLESAKRKMQEKAKK